MNNKKNPCAILYKGTRRRKARNNLIMRQVSLGYIECFLYFTREALCVCVCVCSKVFGINKLVLLKNKIFFLITKFAYAPVFIISNDCIKVPQN